jgi:pyruvate ferredoxin oxidoreductase alpha subunit
MAEAVKRANVDIAVAYPITLQSEVMHLVEDIWARGYLKDYYRAEEEYDALSTIAGAVGGGVRAFSATSEPGPLMDIETIASYPGHKTLAMLVSKTIFQIEQFLEEIDSVEYGGK